jgi:hypothetical protein
MRRGTDARLLFSHELSRRSKHTPTMVGDVGNAPHDMEAHCAPAVALGVSLRGREALSGVTCTSRQPSFVGFNVPPPDHVGRVGNDRFQDLGFAMNRNHD